MKKKKEEIPAQPTRIEIVTFRRPDFAMSQMREDDPYCWNGVVSLVKWRVVAEIVDEPQEVVAERIKTLWRNCDNMHHVRPLLNKAAEYGIELDFNDRGVDVRKR